MSEVEGFDPADVQEIITPEADNAKIIRQYVELLVHDDPDLKLETADPAELDRLQMRLIGWDHTPEYAPALFREIEDYKPQVLIMESFGDTEASVKNKEMIYNLLMFGLPTYVGINGEYSQPDIVGDHEHEQIMNMIRDSQVVFPIYRKMDATAEQARALGLSEITRPHQIMLDDLDWHLRPLPELRRDFAEAFAADGRGVRAREAIMTEGVSRIAANALDKLEGDIRIMVCFGSSHTPVARHFQKLGINADLRFIDRDTHELTSTIRFREYDQAVREANFYGETSPKRVGDFMLRSLLQLQTLSGLNYGEGGTNAQKLKQFDTVAAGIAAAHGPDIWKSWENIHARRLVTRRMKENAVLAFEDLLERVVSDALQQTEHETDRDQNS